MGSIQPTKTADMNTAHVEIYSKWNHVTRVQNHFIYFGMCAWTVTVGFMISLSGRAQNEQQYSEHKQQPWYQWGSWLRYCFELEARVFRDFHILDVKHYLKWCLNSDWVQSDVYSGELITRIYMNIPQFSTRPVFLTIGIYWGPQIWRLKVVDFFPVSTWFTVTTGIILQC